jgi:hypothetical protein
MNNKKNNINNKNIIQIDKSEFDFISKLIPVAEIL